jgi:hypothetical protein
MTASPQDTLSIGLAWLHIDAVGLPAIIVVAITMGLYLIGRPIASSLASRIRQRRRHGHD